MKFKKFQLLFNSWSLFFKISIQDFVWTTQYNKYKNSWATRYKNFLLFKVSKLIHIGTCVESLYRFSPTWGDTNGHYMKAISIWLESTLIMLWLYVNKLDDSLFAVRTVSSKYLYFDAKFFSVYKKISWIFISSMNYKKLN